MSDTIRVLRILEYTGPRKEVEELVGRCPYVADHQLENGDVMLASCLLQAGHEGVHEYVRTPALLPEQIRVHLPNDSTIPAGTPISVSCASNPDAARRPSLLNANLDDAILQAALNSQAYIPNSNEKPFPTPESAKAFVDEGGLEKVLERLPERPSWKDEPMCECGHPLAAHSWSGCLIRLTDEYYCTCMNIQPDTDAEKFFALRSAVEADERNRETK